MSETSARFPMWFDGRTQGKGEVLQKEVLVIILLVSSDAILNLCVHVTAGKHFTTQGISLQMEAKIKSLHT